MTDHKSEEGMSITSRIYECTFIVSEIIVIILYATCVSYDTANNTFDVAQDT